jgi:succinate dehydrogenase hydrophobic anchor subunit
VTVRRLLLVLVLVTLVVLLKPRVVWQEFSRMWAQRETILRLLVTVVGLYLLYGLYTIWSTGVFR